jgi:hypothetical protein
MVCACTNTHEHTYYVHTHTGVILEFAHSFSTIHIIVSRAADMRVYTSCPFIPKYGSASARCQNLSGSM